MKQHFNGKLGKQEYFSMLPNANRLGTRQASSATKLQVQDIAT